MTRRARWCGAVLLHQRAKRRWFAVVARFLERRHIGRWRWRRRAENILEDVLAAKHDRRAIRIRRHREHRALAEQAASVLVGNPRAREGSPLHPWYRVVLREPLVQERVVSRQQVEDVSVLAH